MPWIFPKQSILYFILQEKEKMYQISYTLHKVPFKREFVTKFLGVYSDENISSKHHINILSTKVCKSIGILYRACWILSKFLRKQLCFSFINCYWNYANIVWASTNGSKLQGLYGHQKHAARIINFKDKFTSAKTTTWKN